MIKADKLPIILLIIWTVAATGFSFYYRKNNQKLKIINNSLLESLIEANKLAKNTGEAYKVFGECMTNLNTCDKDASEKRLIELNEEKIGIEKRFQEIQIKLQPFLHK